MKDKSDLKTVDAFPTPKKRGRPATGNAMSAAERKRLQRSRAAAIRFSMCKTDIATAPVTSLIEELATAVRSGDVDTAKRISAELMRRAKENRDGH